jgi:hypothetical protein
MEKGRVLICMHTGNFNPLSIPIQLYHGGHEQDSDRVTLSLFFFVVFSRSLFVPLSFFFWQLYCLFFVDLRFQLACS